MIKIPSVDPSKIIRFTEDVIAEGVNYDGVNCKIRQFTIYERMETNPTLPDLGIHVHDGIKPIMKRG